MRSDPEKHRRRSIRLKGYDFGQAGAYFVTVCTQGRACLLGVVNGEMQVNNAGRMVQASWDELPRRFAGMRVDGFVVMPNHIHGIIMVGAQFIAPHDMQQNVFENPRQGAMNRAPTLGEIVRAFKAVSTRAIRQTTNPTFAWQRNYYEHVIRDDDSLNRIRQYILDNPARWAFDRENPAATTPEPEEAWLAGSNPVSQTCPRSCHFNSCTK
ncbi:MAG TPA: transposase [Candidatus Binatia bacterium]